MNIQTGTTEYGTHYSHQNNEFDRTSYVHRLLVFHTSPSLEERAKKGSIRRILVIDMRALPPKDTPDIQENRTVPMEVGHSSCRFLSVTSEEVRVRF